MKEEKEIDYQIVNLKMLAPFKRTLVFENEFILADNLDVTDQKQENDQVPTSDYPLKIQFAIVLICQKGTIRMRINMVEYTLNDNELLTILPNSVIDNISCDSESRLCIIAFSNYDLIPETNLKGSIYIRRMIYNQYKYSVREDDLEDILSLYRMIKRRMQKKNYELLRESIRGFLQILFCDTYHVIASKENIMEQQIVKRQQILFDRFLRCVHEHYLEERSIRFYADKLCITSKYLSREIFKVSGRYAGEWIRDFVILEAKALLKSGLYTVQQVGDRLNFPNPSFFCKYFKAATGQTPRNYQLGKE